MGVDRCACRKITFASLKVLSDRHGWGFEALKCQTGCASDCTKCETYIRRMLRTGQTVFPVPASEVRATSAGWRPR